MRISDWSSDVCSSDLNLDDLVMGSARFDDEPAFEAGADDRLSAVPRFHVQPAHHAASARRKAMLVRNPFQPSAQIIATPPDRSEEHTSELQSLMRISYAVFCLKNKIKNIYITTSIHL